jgi:putative transposase
MKKKRFTEQHIIGFLKEAQAGVAVKELCRKIRVQRCSLLWLAGEVWWIGGQRG